MVSCIRDVQGPARTVEIGFNFATGLVPKEKGTTTGSTVAIVTQFARKIFGKRRITGQKTIYHTYILHISYTYRVPDR